MTERLPPLPEPLTAEERVLAARLARLGPHGEPSPALDARILAAARAELSAPAISTRKPVRWPLTLGIAASVALAVGLAWQLRPLPEPVAYDEAAGAVGVAASVPEADMQAEDAAASAPATTAAPAEPSPPAAFGRTAAPRREAAAEQPRVADAQADNASSEARQERYRAKPAPPASPPVVLQAPPVAEPEAGVAADIVALPAPPPPAPATQAAKAAAPAAPPSAHAMARAAAERRAQAEAAQSRASAEAQAAAAAAEDSFADEPFVEDVPPATADSPMVRDAWLHRIRELQAAGDTDAARASLEEFVRRYPDVPLPEDLQPLLD